MFTQSLVVIRTPVASLATILLLCASLFFSQLSIVSAQTPSALGQHKSNAELQVMISALMAQIAALQNGGTSTGASDEYGCNPGGSCLGTVLKATMQPAVQDISSAIKLVKAEPTSVDGYLSGIFEIEITAQDSALYIHTNSFNLAPVLNEKIVTQNNQKFTKTVTSTATKSGVYYVIHEGETKSFKVSFSYQPIATGSYRIIMQDFSFALTATGRLFIHEMPYPNRPETDAVQYKNSVPAVVVPNTGNTITVTVPNGGESWEIGMLNTVTWKPYGYNPDVNPARDVTAYLEVKNADGSFKTLGKVQESGKASIHWPTGELNSLTAGGNYASAGNGYYIKIVNNKTGASDRSDNPFTLVAKPVDLKINGSDGPVTVSQNQPVTLSWSVSSVERCEIHNAYKDARRTTQIGSVPLSGQMVAYLHPDLSWGPTLYCYRKDGSSVYDSVKRTSVTNNTLSIVNVISPNGGEILNATQLVKVNYNAQGISTISVALYKNDMWKAWIVKDVNIQTREKVSVEFTPSKIIQGLGQGDNKGDLFKIYITGKKADGAGYIDDKSDQAFQFESGAVSVKGEAPKKNIFNCNRSVMAKVASGSIACYGMWDYGEDFGGDVKMCGSYDGKTGCVIQTPVCTSGTAKATKYIGNGSFSATNLPTISKRLGVTETVAKAGIAGLWEYACVTTTAVPTTTSCTNGLMKYTEGTSLQSIIVNGQTQIIADASYVCRSGVWKIEGSFPVKPIDSTISTIYGLPEIKSVTFKDSVTQSSMATFSYLGSNWGTRTERTYTVTLKTEKVITVREILNTGGTSADPIKASGFTGTSVEFKSIATRAPEVRGASIDMLSEISSTLISIKNILSDLK